MVIIRHYTTPYFPCNIFLHFHNRALCLIMLTAFWNTQLPSKIWNRKKHQPIHCYDVIIFGKLVMYTTDPNNTTVSTLTSGWDSLGLCQCFYGNGVVASLLDKGSAVFISNLRCHWLKSLWQNYKCTGIGWKPGNRVEIPQWYSFRDSPFNNSFEYRYVVHLLCCTSTTHFCTLIRNCNLHWWR